MGIFFLIPQSYFSKVEPSYLWFWWNFTKISFVSDSIQLTCVPWHPRLAQQISSVCCWIERQSDLVWIRHEYVIFAAYVDHALQSVGWCVLSDMVGNIRLVHTPEQVTLSSLHRQ